MAIIKPEQLSSGSYSISGSFSGSFQGDGSQLSGIAASKWSGSNPITRDSNVEITGSLQVTGTVSGSFVGDGSQLTGVEAFPFTGSAEITGSLNVIGTSQTSQLGVGASPSGSTKLDVRAQGALSTDIAFRVRNSADTSNMFTVNGDGTQTWFTPGNNVLNSIKSGAFNIIQYGNDAFGNIAVGYNSSNMITPTTAYNTVLGANASSGVNSSFAIGIGWGSIVNGAGNICIGRTRTIGSYSIKIGYDGGASQYGGTNSIHLGKTVSGNNITADNVFMTYFNSQSSSTLTRSNGSFGLLGQQAYIITNGTGALGLTTFMGDGGNTLVVRNHPSIPTLNITDSFQQYSADIVAGNAAPHFRTENGNVIKLYQQSAVTSSQGLADVLTNVGLLATGSSIAASSAFPYTGSAQITGSLTVTGSIYTDSTIYSPFAISLNFLSAQTYSYKTPYAIQVNSVESDPSASIEIIYQASGSSEVTSSYSFGSTVNKFDKLIVTPSSASLVILNSIRI
jgi:hypothetical protein